MSKFFLCAPQKGQGADIVKEKLNEIFEKYPLLKKEYVKYNASKDYFLIVFKNSSTFEVATTLNSQRGERKHAGIIDEVRDHDGTALNEIVLPLLNVDRRTVTGELDEEEPNQQQI